MVMFALENEQIHWLDNSIYPKKIFKDLIYEGIPNEVYKS